MAGNRADRGPLTRPVGTITRGTTGVNRLRRSDRWLVNDELVAGRLRAATDPLVVDLGYGAAPWTTLELAGRLRTVRPDVRVVGLEIDPDRVRGRPIKLAAGGWALSLALGLGAGLLLQSTGVITSELYVGLALTTTDRERD